MIAMMLMVAGAVLAFMAAGLVLMGVCVAINLVDEGLNRIVTDLKGE